MSSLPQFRPLSNEWKTDLVAYYRMEQEQYEDQATRPDKPTEMERF